MDLDSAFSVNFDLAKINVLVGILPTLTKAPLRRILEMHQVEFEPSDGTSKLRKKLENRASTKLLDKQRKHAERESELDSLRSDWPRLVTPERKRTLADAFKFAISSESLSTFICASCSGKHFIRNKRTLGLEEFDLKLLRRPDHPSWYPERDPPADEIPMEVEIPLEDSEQPVEVDMPVEDSPTDDNSMDVDSPCDESVERDQEERMVRDRHKDANGEMSECPEQCSECVSDPGPCICPEWLDPECVPPPMPCSPDGIFEDALIDEDGIESGEAGEPVLATCKNCYSFLKRGKVPRLALSNRNFLEKTDSAIGGSTLARVLTPPVNSENDWMPSNLNIYIPLGGVTIWEAFLAEIRLGVSSSQPGIHQRYKAITNSHLHYGSLMPNHPIMLTESIDACVITPAVAASTTLVQKLLLSLVQDSTGTLMNTWGCRGNWPIVWNDLTFPKLVGSAAKRATLVILIARFARNST
ncbi:hypothetical protein B0H13DRAFT_1853251 [Mycena leptocephala]|nr:hypothetical protein B0H13DRAFT_1853251 [Mycena leptocephala]